MGFRQQTVQDSDPQKKEDKQYKSYERPKSPPKKHFQGKGWGMRGPKQKLVVSWS